MDFWQYESAFLGEAPAGALHAAATTPNSELFWMAAAFALLAASCAFFQKEIATFCQRFFQK